MNVKIFAGIFVLSLAGCITAPPPIPLVPDSGFVAFDTPRTFDPPGQIFRKDTNGVVWEVGALSVTPKTGWEQTMNMSTKADWSLQSLLETIGITSNNFPAISQFDLQKVREGTLNSVKGYREYIQDSDNPENKATELIAQTTYRSDNTYYLIRATVSTTNLDYTSTNRWIVDLGLKSLLTNYASTSNHINIDNETNLSINTTFDQLMRVWYQAEQLVPKSGLGIGPNAVPTFNLIPATNGFVLPATEPVLAP